MKRREDVDHERVTIAQRALRQERTAAAVGSRGRRLSRPECLVVGHAWTDDPGREGGTICMVCQVVRFP